MAMPAPLYYTAEMVLALPDDGNRYEAVHGELLVSPSPRALHQLVLDRLNSALAEYLKREPVGARWFAPADISWSPDTLVQPDCFVVPLDEARTLDWARMKTLLLAVEVLSPTTARADRFTKRRLYQEQRIPTYWIVDCEERSVELWTPDALFPTVERNVLHWHPAGAATPCVIALEELFRPL